MPVTIRRICPALIERDDDLAALDRALAAISDSCQVALLRGEAGIGKSRLAAEFRRHAEAQGCLVLTGTCFEQDRDLPFAPFIDMFRRTDHAPDLISLLMTPGTGASPAQEKHFRFDAVIEALQRLARQQPIVLILEDLHWADPTSLDLLEVLPHRLDRIPVVILGTTRLDPARRDLAKCTSALRRIERCVDLELGALDVAATANMVMLLQGTPPSRAMATAIHHRTDGNPFFIEELIAATPARDRLAWILEDQSVPLRIQDVIIQLTADLPEPAQRVLDFAAVAGQDVSFELIASGLDLPPETLVSALRALVERSLLVEVPVNGSSRFAFRHALTRDTILARLIEPERRSLHRQIAETLERAAQPGTPGPGLAGELGRHFHDAGLWNQALAYASTASDNAWQIGATIEALNHGSRALDAALALNDVRATDLQRRCGQACALLGLFDRAHRHFEAALTMAQEHSLEPTELAVLDDLAGLYASRDYGRARQIAEHALTRATALGRAREHSVALNRLGNILTNLGTFTEGLALHESALTICENEGDAWGTANSWDLIGMTRYLAGDIPGARLAFASAITHFETLGDIERLASARTSRGLYLAVIDGWCPTNDPPMSFRADAETGLQLSRQIAWRAGEAYALVAIACADIGDAALDDARRHAELALSIAEEIGHDQWQIIALLTLGIEAAERLDIATAETHIRRARELASAATANQWRVRLDAWLDYLAAIGSSVLQACRALPESPSIGHRRSLLATCERERRAGNAGEALALIDTLPVQASAGFEWLRGRLLADLGRNDEADSALTTARGQATATGPRTLLWRIAATRAGLWRETDPDLARAETVIAAQEIAHLANHIADPELKQRFLTHPEVRPWAGQPARSSKTPGHVLTPRERDIARLVATGLGNKEIARELGIAAKTVEMHVSNCLGKLGFVSRAQLAAWAVSSGLVTPGSSPSP